MLELMTVKAFFKLNYCTVLSVTFWISPLWLMALQQTEILWSACLLTLIGCITPDFFIKFRVTVSTIDVTYEFALTFPSLLNSAFSCLL